MVPGVSLGVSAGLRAAISGRDIISLCTPYAYAVEYSRTVCVTVNRTGRVSE